MQQVHIYIYIYIYIYISYIHFLREGTLNQKNRPYLSPTPIKHDQFYGRRLPSRQLGKPGRRALCTEEGGQQGAVAEKQQETCQANENVADSYGPGVNIP